MRDVGDAARAVGRHSGDEQGDSGADVGTCHSATAKLDFSVVADDDGAMRVAKDDLCAHIDEFIDEKQATFKHFLVDEHRTASLRRHDEQNGEQIGRESGPGRVGKRHNGAVDERFHGVALLSRNEKIVARHLDFDAEASEGVGDDAEVFQRHVFDGDAVADHRRHTDERADFNHIGQNRVNRAAERLHALNCQQVRGDAADSCAHRVEHLAKLLDIRLAGGVVDGRRSLRQHSSHNDVGRACDRRFVEKHRSAFEGVG